MIGGLLRDELRFDGVVITDSTEAAAVQEVTGVQEAAIRNIPARAWRSRHALRRGRAAERAGRLDPLDGELLARWSPA